jgi:histidinol-phosphatase (PHP family)
MELPADGHVHSQWSWDTVAGSMERTCARAMEIGLSALAFTDHLDSDPWVVAETDLNGADHVRELVRGDGDLHPPPLNETGYFAALDRCRQLFPSLTLLSGVEVGSVHRHPDLGSMHVLQIGDHLYEPPGLYRRWPAATVIRESLAEMTRMIQASDAFTVLTHIDYAVRHWPTDAGVFDPLDFEEDYRATLRALADTDRALEVNTVVPLSPVILGWWREEGGRSIAFGSDAHSPRGLGRGIAAAAMMALEEGFVPGEMPGDFWSIPEAPDS